jgi:hypothetical protein
MAFEYKKKTIFFFESQYSRWKMGKKEKKLQFTLYTCSVWRVETCLPPYLGPHTTFQINYFSLMSSSKFPLHRLLYNDFGSHHVPYLSCKVLGGSANVRCLFLLPLPILSCRVSGYLDPFFYPIVIYSSHVL